MNTLIKNKATEQFLSQAPDLQSFPQIREKGKFLMEEKGLPALKEEEYKFTSITKKLEQTLTDFSAAKKTSLDQETVKANLFEGFDGDLLVFNNGNFDKS